VQIPVTVMLIIVYSPLEEHRQKFDVARKSK